MWTAGLILGGWALCGVLAYGATFAEFEREFQEIAEECRPQHRAFALYMGCLGPIGLLIACLGSRCFRHGFKWR